MKDHVPDLGLSGGGTPDSGPDAAESGKLAVFTGSTPNVGTTLAAFGTALHLAERTGQPVAFLCLNLKSSKLHRYLGMESCSLGLDQVRAEMRSASLTPGLLRTSLDSLKGRQNLHILYGTGQREQAEFFQPEDIRHLLDAARAAYGICVAEVNAYWDNAATVTALMEADARVMVTTTDLGHFQEDVDKGLKTMAPLFGIAPESFLLAVNQAYAKGGGGIHAQDAERETGMKLASVIPWDPALREWMNQGRLAEYAGCHKPFVQALQPLGNELAERLGVSFSSGSGSAGPARSWRPLFSGR